MLELLKMESSGSVSSNANDSNSTEINIVKLFAREVFKLEEFFIAICNDVLVEVLSFGSRFRLGKLELVGRRFNWTVENFFGGRPFIRLDFDLTERFLIFNNHSRAQKARENFLTLLPNLSLAPAGPIGAAGAKKKNFTIILPFLKPFFTWGIAHIWNA